jgi:hypothetical protein
MSTKRVFKVVVGIGTTFAVAGLHIHFAAADTIPYSYGLLPAQSSGSGINDDSALLRVSSGYYAAAFDSPSGENAGGVAFTGFPARDGAGVGGYIALAGFGHDYNGYFGSALTTGDPALDSLLTEGNYADGTSVGQVTFSQLIAGQTYEAQFLVTDNRSSQDGRAVQIANTSSFADNESDGDYATSPLQYAMGGSANLGAYVDWTFTASETSQTFYDRVTNANPGSSQDGSPQGTQINAAVITPTPAPASLIWYGNPADGTTVFKHIDIETSGDNYISNNSDGSYALVESDPAYGQIFAFHKIASDKRAEAHGAAGFNPAIGKTYYIGWAFKLSSTVTDNAIFQWKAYGSPMTQDFPIVLKCISGDLTLQYYAPGIINTTLFSTPINSNTWYQSVIEIGVSDSTGGGRIEFWLNGMQEVFSNGSIEFAGKTFDGSSVDPKWGIYGAVGTDVTDDVADIRIGATYADVAPPDPPAAASPEPAALTLLGLSAGAGMLFLHRRTPPAM